MANKVNSITDANSVDQLIHTAKRKLDEIEKWSERLWAWNCWLTGAAAILSGLVPFGLGLLLFMPQEYSQTTNIILIIMSAIAFVPQVWNITQRNGLRAKHLREVGAELESAIASYQEGVIDRDEFSKELQKALKRKAQEPAP